MNGKLAIERLYSLAQYENLKITREITEIPQSILGNPNAIDLLSYSLLLSIEKAYRKYIQLENQYKNAIKDVKSLDEALQISIDLLEEEHSKTFQELYTELAQDNIGQDNRKEPLEKQERK